MSIFNFEQLALAIYSYEWATQARAIVIVVNR